MIFKFLSILKILNKKHNHIEGVVEILAYDKNKPKNHSEIKNIRHLGYLIAFDFETKEFRNYFVELIKKNGLLCNPTRLKTV